MAQLRSNLAEAGNSISDGPAFYQNDGYGKPLSRWLGTFPEINPVFARLGSRLCWLVENTQVTVAPRETDFVEILANWHRVFASCGE